MSATPSVTSILAPDWGEDLSATELIAQEKSNLHKELEWLLRMEVPAVFMQLGLMLKDCAQTLAGPSGVSSAVAQASVFTAPITNTSDSVKGFAMLEGSRIIKADVTVRFSKWNKSLPISTSITSKEPWILSQIQNATNYVQLALSELDDSSLQHGLFHTREQVQSVMDRVMAFLRKAQDQLLFQSNLFPYNIDDLQLVTEPTGVLMPLASFSPPTRFCIVVAHLDSSMLLVCLITTSQNAFNPRLPADLFVDFSINYAALNVSVTFRKGFFLSLFAVV
ncbi:hypothetical protein CAOG_08356 [Capsaspora owczarzaki ATCC 30864]|uniref:hypothetical protein n=1 Tax=Capsaspora owczarzaki (strain ATCC 30864) TaxID=595528 RepID=UPI0001FE3090|nr:hypothetical protein CAOG_08356 [Capsaspora owczarzaki ATCC 30864]|eukprot:XP_004340772.1 hypothetical protein CAOG_08356 [Capsaspora owczarzaki ATCC 30864]